MDIKIRRAQKKDTERVLALLSQVLELHAKIRPDIFISGTTKYTEEELTSIFADPLTPVFVAVDEEDKTVGYAFCILKLQPATNNMKEGKTLFIDDLCVDEKQRGRGIGNKLYDFLLGYAKEEDCGSITLNLWEGNEDALKFYESRHMGVKKREMEYILK